MKGIQSSFHVSNDKADPQSSSLRSVETTTRRIEDAVTGIKDKLTSGPLALPVASGPSTLDKFTLLSFSEQCFKAAEITQRWTAIGIEEWIKAGRWWIMKVLMLSHVFGDATV